jgi:hypothetical protein
VTVSRGRQSRADRKRSVTITFCDRDHRFIGIPGTYLFLAGWDTVTILRRAVLGSPVIHLGGGDS